MSDAGYLSDSNDSEGIESPITSPDTSPLRDSSPFAYDVFLSRNPMLLPEVEPEPITPFPLMKLPPELRLNIYDQLFTDLTIGRQRKVADLNKYHRADEWPDNDFSDYISLLLTCKEIYQPAKSLWEKVYIPKCCFYFWKMPEFHRVASALVKLGEPYQSARYALRSRAFDEIGSTEAEFIDMEADTFMDCQPGFPNHDPDYSEFHWMWPKFPYTSRSGAHTLYPHGRVPVEIYRQGPKHKKYGRAQFPGLQDCSLAVHERNVSDAENHYGTRYMLMSGEVGSIFWGGYDVDIGIGKQLIWDEWERRGFPDSCLARGAIVQTLRARLELGMADLKKINECKEPIDHERAMNTVESIYNLGSWLREVAW
jgi:hypothetical protein